MSQTNYYVLCGVEGADDDTLVVCGTAEAGTGEAAIRKVAKEQDLTLDGRFVAVPVRNWTEIEFEVVERDPVITANYISERRTRPRAIPGQTTIEDEVEAADLAAEIEGETDVPEGELFEGVVTPDEELEVRA